MKKGIFIVLAIAAVVAISQWPTPTEEAPIEKSSVVDTPEILGSSSETILAKSVNDDEVQEGEVTASSEENSDLLSPKPDQLPSNRQPRPLDPWTQAKRRREGSRLSARLSQVARLALMMRLHCSSPGS